MHNVVHSVGVLCLGTDVCATRWPDRFRCQTVWVRVPSLLSMCDIFGPFLKRTSVKKTDSMLLIFVSRWTDGLTDRRTDRQTDTPAHRCVRMNLKQDPIIVPLPLKFWWPECHRNLRYMEKERKGKKKEEKNCQSRISRFDIFPIFFFFFYPWLVFNSK